LQQADDGAQLLLAARDAFGQVGVRCALPVKLGGVVEQRKAAGAVICIGKRTPGLGAQRIECFIAGERQAAAINMSGRRRVAVMFHL
jgi:hypothetical protein